MASTSQIHSFRIDINDPSEIINIESVATPAALPTEPGPQTAYYIISKVKYVITEKESAVAESDYETCELFLSDTKISTLIDAHGYDIAKYKAIKLIASKLGSKLLIVKNTAGADSTEYIKLLDLYKYYKSLVDDFKEETTNASGRLGRTKYTRNPGQP